MRWSSWGAIPKCPSKGARRGQGQEAELSLVRISQSEANQCLEPRDSVTARGPKGQVMGTSPHAAHSGQHPRKMPTLPPPPMHTHCTPYPQPPGDPSNSSLPTLPSPEFIAKGEEKVDQIS